MKQRITVEQLHELSEEKKEKLRKWWNPQIGDFYIFKYEGEYWHEPWFHNDQDGYHKFMNEDGEDPIPLLTIGQMIEILYEWANDFGIHYNDSGVCFYVYLSWTMDTALPDRMWMNDELCDALWEAVKAV